VILAIISAIIVLLLTPSVVLADSLQLNELMPHPSSGNDWVEIYNPTSSAVDLTNWTLVDSTSTMKTLSGNITPNGFTSFEVSNRLNNGGDSIYLKDATGAVIDNYTYTSDPGIDFSFGRQPDGGSWITLTSSSQGTSNGGSSPATPTPTSLPTSTASPTPTTTPKPTPTLTPTPTTKKSPTSTNAPAPTASKNPTSSPTIKNIEDNSLPVRSLVKTNYQIASIAGINASNSASPSAAVEVKAEKFTNFLPWIGGILVIGGLSSLIFIYFKAKKNENIHH